ncbi:hypothetical protein MCEMIH16_01353 [Caulobacteraceae bacterium]|jgi:hypothetical protein
MTHEQAETDLACLRLAARDFVGQLVKEGIDPFLIGLAMTMAGTDLINATAGPGAAHAVAEGAKARVDRSMVAPDGKPH